MRRVQTLGSLRDRIKKAQHTRKPLRDDSGGRGDDDVYRTPRRRRRPAEKSIASKEREIAPGRWQRFTSCVNSSRIVGGKSHETVQRTTDKANGLRARITHLDPSVEDAALQERLGHGDAPVEVELLRHAGSRHSSLHRTACSLALPARSDVAEHGEENKSREQVDRKRSQQKRNCVKMGRVRAQLASGGDGGRRATEHRWPETGPRSRAPSERHSSGAARRRPRSRPRRHSRTHARRAKRIELSEPIR